jgi:NTE family protein
MLAQVRCCSSVSGGSVANALFAHHYPDLAAEGFSREAFDAYVLNPFVATITATSLSRGMLRKIWRIIGRRTRTDLLADEFDRLLFARQLLEELPADCRFVFNAANTTTGVRFGFERDVTGDYVMGRVPTAGTNLRVAQAVAASAAVPGAFAPMTLPNITFPCQRERPVRLIDGGAYDNMGLEPIDGLADHLLVALNAGGLFVTGQYGKLPLIRDLQLAQSLLYRQSTALRRRWMVERFKEWEAAQANNQPPPDWGRRGVLFGLATTLEPTPEWSALHPLAPVPEDVAFVKTSFDRFPADVCHRLVYAGWWLTGATLTRFHPTVLPQTIPPWSDLA